ncbi:outer membrane receptor protein involved in Fe transport [Sphingopyxis panaciterrae]|uniref:TonB-dependent receptor n=1 Tax=Sphingopyxis panaciterrae TaxID=363841 RepID=UPI0014207230|nr:TonB-dependent receptor [Sphingopyxis panaciterrae]NIJ39380.1 outer membrane receptor protein involved in Fe transport [Sphingopyxis panaciterrae]
MNKWSIGLAASTALLPVPALAQAANASAPAAAAPDADAPDAAQEIVVTAQKRSERLRDVPAAITAVTSASLQELNAAKLDDYVARIPGLTVSQVGGASAATQLSIRGITTGSGGNPTVGIYIDESPFGASTIYGGYTVPDLDPQDLQRVEVLRGPQGTLYGAGSLGGLLKYVTADPDPTRFFGRFQVDGSAIDGGGEGYGVRAAANIPLSDDLALRISGYNRLDPGYVDNVLTGERNINDMRFYGGRVALGWQSGDWKVRLSGLFQHYDGNAPVVDYDSTTFKPFYGDLKQSRVPDSTNVKQDVGAVSLLVEGDLGFATLTSASAYNRQKMQFDNDYSPILSPSLAPVFGIPTLGFVSVSPVKVEKFTQELRLASPATNRLSWQLGLFYTRETQNALGDVVPIDSETGAVIDGLPNIGRSDLGASFREVAVFGDMTYHFSSAFDVTAGLRYSRNQQHNLTITSGLIYGDSTNNVRSRDSAMTFLINPRLRLDENTMLYARIASGFRPGGPNSVTPALPQSYAPDKVTDYEIGLKSELFGRSLSLELSGYWIDWRDIQIQRIAPELAASYIDNGPTAVSKGIEASASWRPVRGLEIYGNIAYNDAHLTEDLPTNSAIGVSGDRLPLSARWSGAAGASYSLPLFGAWNGSLGVDWRHVGARLGAFPNAGQVRYQLPSYDVVDLRAGISDDRWSFSIYAKNIGDERGQGADINLGLTRVSVIQPRTFGVSAAVKF